MPNWCENELVVKGSPKALRAFQHVVTPSAADGVLDFERICPSPRALAGLAHDERCCPLERARVMRSDDDWRACGRVQTWGTKSNAVDASVDGTPDEGSLRYVFLTAWSPADIVVFALGVRFPELEIDYAFGEAGAIFAGRLRKDPHGWWRTSLADLDETACRQILAGTELAASFDPLPLDMDEEADDAA
jgi:hypothetical protein